MRHVHSDGGRWAAGLYWTLDSDCVCRAISIASGRPYREIHTMLERLGRRNGHPDWGIEMGQRRFHRLMRHLGFRLVKTRFHRRIVRLRSSDLPAGRLVVMIDEHATAVIDRRLYDLSDCSCRGQAIVHAYWIYEGPPIFGVPPGARLSNLGVIDQIKLLTREIVAEAESVYVTIYREYFDEFDKPCWQRVMQVVAQSWPGVSARRWELASRRARIEIERKLREWGELYSLLGWESCS